VNRLRAVLVRNRRLALCLLALTLTMRAIVPAGLMVGTQAMVLTIEICADATGQHLTTRIVIPRDGNSDGDQPAPGKSAPHCPFASHGAAALDGMPTAIIAFALAFLLVLGFAPTSLVRLRPLPFLRPPLRAPPARA
jgi:hypothetical protein